MDIKTIGDVVLYSSALLTIKDALVEAVSKRKDLTGADLTGAYLTGADRSRCNAGEVRGGSRDAGDGQSFDDRLPRLPSGVGC